MKMLLIGLGKHAGAKIYHRAVQDYSFDQIVRSAAGEILNAATSWPAWRSLENAYDETALIEAVAPADFERREVELLRLARQWMPRLPFRSVDVLLIDEIGKNFSGVGHRHQRGGAEVQRAQGRRGRVPQGEADRPARPEPAEPRQRHRHRHGRVLPLAVVARHGLRRHATERR